MNRSQTKKVAKETIMSGKSRQEAFEELQDVSVLTNTDLAKVIRNIASLYARQQHNGMNIALIVLLGISIILKMIAGLPVLIYAGLKWAPLILFLPIVNILLLIGVIMYNHISYKILAILSALSLLRVLYLFTKPITNNTILFDLGSSALFVFFALYMHIKLFPNFWSEREMYQTASGEMRSRYVVKFED